MYEEDPYEWESPPMLHQWAPYLIDNEVVRLKEKWRKFQAEKMKYLLNLKSAIILFRKCGIPPFEKSYMECSWPEVEALMLSSLEIDNEIKEKADAQARLENMLDEQKAAVNAPTTFSQATQGSPFTKAMNGLKGPSIPGIM